MDDLPIELRAKIMRVALRSMDFRIKMGVINKLSPDLAGTLKDVLARSKRVNSWGKEDGGGWVGSTEMRLGGKYILMYGYDDEVEGDAWTVYEPGSGLWYHMNGKADQRQSWGPWVPLPDD
jgi:hypothetical protein